MVKKLEATVTAVVIECEVLSSNVTNGLADSCATIGLSASSQQGGECIAPTRFGGVGAWRVRRNSVVFLRSRDRGSEDAVVFPEIGGDGYFD